MQKEKFLILKGCAGLGNRLITICAAIAYAKKTDRTLFVDWSDGQFGEKGKNVFYQFFDLTGVKYISSLEEVPSINSRSVYPQGWKGNMGKGVYDLYEFESPQGNPIIAKLLNIFNPKGSLAKARGFWKPKGYSIRANRLKDRLEPIFKTSCFPIGSYYEESRSEDIVVFTDFTPSINQNIFLDHVKLQDHFNSVVKYYVKNLGFSNNSIGVHIRATDKKPSSQVKNIFDKIEQLKLTKPTIFLATDNPEVSKEFSAQYKNVVSFADKLPEVPVGMGVHQLGFRSGNGKVAMDVFRQSLLDMWLLSECEYLFYQGNSTFSIISKYLHKNPAKVFDWQATNPGE